MTDKDTPPGWRRMWFKAHKVWVELDEHGKIRRKGGKARLKYNLKQTHEYWVHANALRDLDNPPANPPSKPGPRQPGGPPPPASPAPGAASAGDTPHAPHAIRIYTDGAASGNPGPAGIGVVLLYGDKEKEISKFIGHSTNNIAELEAIRMGLATLKARHLPVRLYTDSNYALGVLTKAWKPKKNIELIGRIKALMAEFADLKMVKVPGHAGLPENERADRLAVAAVKRGA